MATWIDMKNRYVNHLGTVFELGAKVRPSVYKAVIVGVASPKIMHADLVSGGLSMNSYGWFVSAFSEKGENLLMEAGRAPRDQILALGSPYVFSSKVHDELAAKTLELNNALEELAALKRQSYLEKDTLRVCNDEVSKLSKERDDLSFKLEEAEKALHKAGSSSTAEGRDVESGWFRPATTGGYHIKIAGRVPLWQNCTFGVDSNLGFVFKDTGYFVDGSWAYGRREHLLSSLQGDFEGFMTYDGTLYSVLQNSHPVKVRSHGKF